MAQHQRREGGARWGRGSQQGVSEQHSTRACRCPLALSGPPCAPPLPFPHSGRDHPPAQVTAPTSEKEQRALPVLCGSLGSQGTSLGQASGSRMSVQDSLGSPLWPQGKDAGTGGGRGPALWNQKAPRACLSWVERSRPYTVVCICHWMRPTQGGQDVRLRSHGTSSENVSEL